jgi:hypothetical protein
MTILSPIAFTVTALTTAAILMPAGVSTCRGAAGLRHTGVRQQRRAARLRAGVRDRPHERHDPAADDLAQLQGTADAGPRRRPPECHEIVLDDEGECLASRAMVWDLAGGRRTASP